MEIQEHLQSQNVGVSVKTIRNNNLIFQINLSIIKTLHYIKHLNKKHKIEQFTQNNTKFNKMKNKG